MLSRRARLAEAIVMLAHAHWRSKQNCREASHYPCIQSSLFRNRRLRARFLAIRQLGLDRESGCNTTLSG